jgi:serine/threonine protein kinase
VKEIKPGKLEDAQGVAEHWEKEVKALRMMNNLNQEHIVHFVTAFRRRKASGGAEHYLMFEWADGGNLRNLWNSMSSPPLTASLVKDTLKQILGLAKALEAAHNLNKTGASYRHGDLKPENILVFRGNGSIGTLKIGDWGEAKSHEEVTQMRPRNTTARFGTRRYEAPEVEIGIRATYLGQPTKRRSRLYDIWAMGCITLEFVIWLLYGMRGLNRFNSDLGEESFYQIGIVNGNKVAEVNSTAVRWMDFMAIDLRCQVGTTAIGDLLELVRTALLVVRLPRRLGTDLPALPESSGIGLPVPTERSRQDSALSLPNLVRDAEETRNELPTLKVSDDVTAASNPLISFTPAEPEPVKEPVQPEPEPEGTERCLASGFRGRVEHIVEEDESDDYWHTYDPEHPVPANQDPLPSLHQMAVHSKTERQSTTTNKNQGPTVGLAVPTQKRVSSIFVLAHGGTLLLTKLSFIDRLRSSGARRERLEVSIRQRICF